MEYAESKWDVTVVESTWYLVSLLTISSGQASRCMRYRYDFRLLLSWFWFVSFLGIVIGRVCERNRWNLSEL